jgi:hypothetical protein
VIRYERHARRRMRLYRVAEQEVAQVLASPDALTPAGQGRTNAWKRRGDDWLRVTFLAEGEDTVIITVTPRRRGPGGS